MVRTFVLLVGRGSWRDQDGPRILFLRRLANSKIDNAEYSQPF